MLKIWIIILLLFAAQDRAREAYRAYQQQDYVAAERGFREALEQNPTDARLWFNLGNALARQGRVDEAQQAWSRFKAIEQRQQERASAEHNLGNVLSETQRYQDALEAYRRALRNNPADEDTRFNFEWAQRRLQEQEEQQQQQQQQDQSLEMPFERGDSRPEEDDRQPADAQQQQTPPDADQDGAPQQQPQPQDGQLSQEDADNMLNALDNIEQDLIRDFQQRQMDRTPPNEKDW